MVATTPHTFGTRQKPTTLETILEQRFGIPIPNLSELFKSPVESVKEWRANRKASEGAGEQVAVLIKYFTCDICDIGIGPNQYEKEMYFHPIFQKKETSIDDERIVKAQCLMVCGRCAAYKHRMLSEDNLMMAEQYWTSEYLTAIIRSIHLLHEQVSRFLLQLFAIMNHFALSLFWDMTQTLSVLPVFLEQKKTQPAKLLAAPSVVHQQTRTLSTQQQTEKRANSSLDALFNRKKAYS